MIRYITIANILAVILTWTLWVKVDMPTGADMSSGQPLRYRSPDWQFTRTLPDQYTCSDYGIRYLYMLRETGPTTKIVDDGDTGYRLDSIGYGRVSKDSFLCTPSSIDPRKRY